MKKYHLFQFSILSFFVVFSLLIIPTGALATIRYERSPNGTVASGPLNISVSFDNWESDVTSFSGLVSWGVDFVDAEQDVDGNNIVYKTGSVPISTKSNTFTISLPLNRNIVEIRLYACYASGDCSFDGPRFEVDYYSGATIFASGNKGSETGFTEKVTAIGKNFPQLPISRAGSLFFTIILVIIFAIIIRKKNWVRKFTKKR